MSSNECSVTQLAMFFRMNGDRVISGNCKLSLTTHALFSLNNVFNILSPKTPEEEVYLKNKHSLSFFDDANYLFAFISKTLFLKVLHCGQTLCGGVDLSKFKNLKVLELHKVPAHLIVGLDKLSTQLEALICNRSLCFLKEILVHCEHESNSYPVWVALKELNLAFNYIEVFDSSMELLPNVVYVDASHNNLKHVDEIQMLEKLVYLNLSYNLLENVPVVSGLSCYSLKALFLRNNILEDLKGIDVMINLEELDVSYNCLSEYSVLKFLKKLTVLKILNLEGNPLFYHEKHREYTVHYMHPCVIANNFVLNGKILTHDDCMNPFPGERSASPVMKFHQTSINAESVDYMFIIPEPEFTVQDPTHRDIEISSNTSESLSNTCSKNQDLEISVLKSRKTFAQKKNFREALIKDFEENSNDVIMCSVDVIEERNESLIPIHIRTKELLEARRKEYKEGWLIPTRSFQTLIKDTTLKVPHNTPATSYNLAEPLQQLSEQFNVEEGWPNFEIKPEHSEVIEVEETIQEDSLLNLNKEKKVENCAADKILSLNASEWGKSEPFEDSYCTKNMYQSTIHNSSDDSYSNSSCSEDMDVRVFVVKRIAANQGREMFVKIGEHFIKEMDSVSGRIVDYLDLRSLMSVEISEKVEKQDCVEYKLYLIFDSAKTSRQNREYIVYDKDIHQEMFAIFKPFADAKTLLDSAVGAFQCLKCSSKFSKQSVHRKVIKSKNPSTPAEHNLKESGLASDFVREACICPNCGSNVIVETDSLPIPFLQVSKDIKNEVFPSVKHHSSSSCSSDSSLLAKRPVGSTKLSSHFDLRGLAPPVVRDSDKTCISLSKKAVQPDFVLPLCTNENQDISILKSADAAEQLGVTDTFQLLNQDSFQGSKLESQSSAVMRESSNNGFLNFVDLLALREQFSFETFTMIDHRLKLHLEINVLDDDEHLESCLKADVVAFPACEEFSGLLVVSDKKIRVMLIRDGCSGELEKNMRMFYLMPFSVLEKVSVLLGSQGFSIMSCSDNRTFLFLVRDADLCNCFLSHVTEILHAKQMDITPHFVSLVNESLIQIQNEVILRYHPDKINSDPQHEILLHLFAYCEVSDKKGCTSVSIIVTHQDIFLCDVQFKKQNNANRLLPFYEYVPFQRQRILDLIEVQLSEDLLHATISFQDEDGNASCVWVISTRTRSSLLCFLSAFKNPWEAAFKIELPLSVYDKQ